MNKFAATLPATLLAATALSAPASASDVRDIMGTILTDPAGPEAITAKCDQYVNAIEERRTALEAAQGAATVDTTLVNYDQMIALIGAGLGEFELYQQVMDTPELRDAGGACSVRLNSLSSQISLSRAIYDALAAIDASGEDAATQYYLSQTVSGFERAGVALPDDQRARVQAINDELSEISTGFARNIAEGALELRVRPEELAGLPQDFIDARPAGEDGMVVLTTASTDYSPVMRYADSDDLRHRFSELYFQRAYPANDELLRRMFTLRQELAGILGRPNYATLILEDKMLGSPERVQGLIDDMAAIARPVAQHDYDLGLAVLQDLVPGAERVEFWQQGWLSPKAQAHYFDYNPQEARQYFAYDNVRDGVLRLTEDLFGVDIRPWDTPVWHEDVEAYEMVDADGTVLGRFYFDNHPRPGKYTHANMIPIYPGVVGEADEVPVGALVQNLPSGDHSTGLMEHGQVETLLHEFGHMLHGMFGGTQRWFGQSGVATEWDFVEAPSQMLENWVYDYDTLATFAVNAAGETIPRELVEKMNRVRYFNAGLGDMTQLGYTNISLQFHQNPVPADLGVAARGWYNDYAVVPMPDYAQMQDAFGHLDGYSAIYYTYRWSKVIADDLFTRFETEGLRNPQTAADYRHMILDQGGTRPAADLVHDFLGRDISLDAYRESLERGLEE
ncbi:MAG: Zn-dependent oligopeptidase [Erythrobacter sp.]|nr:Zn-dependent oligopeptidase [Erythrobacter sp.]